MAEQRPANVVIYARELPRVVFDAAERLIEFVKKPHAQARSLVFVPHGGCLEVEVRLRLDDEWPRHPSDQRSRNLRAMSARTSVHARAAEGFARYDSSRSRRIL